MFGRRGGQPLRAYVPAEESPGAAGQDTAAGRGPQGYGKRSREKAAPLHIIYMEKGRGVKGWGKSPPFRQRKQASPIRRKAKQEGFPARGGGGSAPFPSGRPLNAQTRKREGQTNGCLSPTGERQNPAYSPSVRFLYRCRLLTFRVKRFCEYD